MSAPGDTTRITQSKSLPRRRTNPDQPRAATARTNGEGGAIPSEAGSLSAGTRDLQPSTAENAPGQQGSFNPVKSSRLHCVDLQPGSMASTRRNHPYLRSRPPRMVPFRPGPNAAGYEGSAASNNLASWEEPQFVRPDELTEGSAQGSHVSPVSRSPPSHSSSPAPLHENGPGPHTEPSHSSTADPSIQPGLTPSMELAPSVNEANFFHHAHHFNIRNFNATQIAHNNWKTLFDHLNPYIAHGAAHNSDERCDAPVCHEQTRITVRENIVSWIERGDRGDGPKKIMWLSGPAGCGKTAIAGSVAEACWDRGLLAASFFFSTLSVSENRRSKRYLITTIASHLAEHHALHDYRAQLLQSIEANSAIFHKRLKDQAECLILGPLRSLQCSDMTLWPVGIVLDGLDEVEAQQYHNPLRQETNRKHESDQFEILDVLFTLVKDPAFPFRIFISSRPERVINQFFLTTAQASTVRLFLDSKYDPDADIRLFLESKFAQIRRSSDISDTLWPGEDVIDRFIGMSSGQFIVPATIVRWVEAGIPQQQLDDILQLEQEGTRSKNPFASLDTLYRHILKRANNPDDDPKLVVKWIVCIGSVWRTATFWRQLLEDVEGELVYRLGPIASLLSIPPSTDHSSPITFYHKSLTDCLSVEKRCGDLYVNNRARDNFLADRIVIVLKGKGPRSPRAFRGAEPRDFWKRFLQLLPLRSQAPVMHRPLASFLYFLSENLRAEAVLSSCDVAWWTDFLFRWQNIGDGGLWFLLGIYCGIHKAMKCERNALPPTQTGKERMHTSRCHAACVHWRMGILAKAKELEWCVHKLEEIKLDELESITADQALKGIKKVGPQLFGSVGRLPLCAVCQPV